MSLEQNASEPTFQGVPSGRPIALKQRRLAKLAYRLSTLGPFAFWVMAFCYPPTNHKALPALPVQILWWTLCLSSPAGIILGAILLVQFYRGTLGARKMGSVYALAAVCVGIMASFFLVIGIPVLMSIRHENHLGRRSGCVSNLKQLNFALSMYMQDYDERYPLAQTWNDGLFPYTKNRQILICPELEADGEKRPTYALNGSLPGVNWSTIASPAQTVTLFDAVPGSNLTGGMELFPNPPRHHEGQAIGFVDGHVKSILPDHYSDLIWTPHLALPSTKPPLRPAEDRSSKKASPTK